MHGAVMIQIAHFRRDISATTGNTEHHNQQTHCETVLQLPKNLGAIISGHNAKVLQDSRNKSQQKVKDCDCLKSRKKASPL